MQKAAEIQEAISEGAISFLMTEYKYMAVFMVRNGFTGRRRKLVRKLTAYPCSLFNCIHIT